MKALLIIITLIGIISFLSEVNEVVNPPTAAQVEAKAAAKAEAKMLADARSSWSGSSSRDKMTGNFRAFARSPKTGPSTPMAFPYGDVESWMGVGCNPSGATWVYIGFTESPNLTDTTLSDGESSIYTQVKWDDKIQKTSLTQKWGGNFLNFDSFGNELALIAASNTVLVELPWYGEGNTYFEYSLKGAAKALGEMEGLCAANK